MAHPESHVPMQKVVWWGQPQGTKNDHDCGVRVHVYVCVCVAGVVGRAGFSWEILDIVTRR